MTDIALIFQPEHLDFDFMVDDGDLVGDEGLNTPAVISIFTDRLARTGDRIPDALPGQAGNPRGWWGNEIDSDNDEIGSRLWLLNREKQLDGTIKRAKQYAAEAAAWIKRDGLADEVLANAVKAADGWIEISLECRNSKFSGNKTVRWNAFISYKSGTLRFDI